MVSQIARRSRWAIAVAFAMAIAAVTVSLSPRPAETAFPGTNGKIVFDSTYDDAPNGSLTGNYKIYVMNSDGSARTRLTHGDAYDFDPAWSPDGTKIVFASTRDDPNPISCWPNCNAEIYVMNADGGSPIRLTTNPAYDATPSWSPDGTKILFSSYRNTPDPRISVMGADGSSQTDLKVYGTYPAWSPDGKKIAFGGGNIWVTDPDGANPVNLTQGSSDDNETPSWSPDGKKIAYSDWTASGGPTIYAVNPDGTGQTQLTTPDGFHFEEYPAWSPDGNRIVYSHYTGTTNIWVMNADGGARAPLTTCQVDSNERPNWQPTAPFGAQGETVPASNPLPCSPPASTPTPTASPSGGHIQGDVNCSGVVDDADFKLLLATAAGVNRATASPGCLSIGVAIVGAFLWGDVNCDNVLSAADALYVLAHLAGIELHQPQGCVAIGHPIK